MSHRGKTPARATRAGFTLIELIIVMALLLIVVGIINIIRGIWQLSQAQNHDDHY